MKELNNKLDGLSELVTRIDAKILDINTKLDELIKALHEYDGNDEYGESSFEAFQDEALEKAAAKYSEIDILKWNVDGAERRMDIIGQNGNEGLHYDSHHVTNKEADEDARINNTQTKRVGENKLVGGYGVPNNVVAGKNKKRNKRKYYKPKQ